MNREIRLRVCRETGVPYAIVPCAYIWEFVEHLARHRTRVHYTYGRTHFQVYFMNLDMAGARRVLDDWAATHTETEAPPPENQLAEALP